MKSSKALLEQDELVVEVEIAVPPERVFQALTDAKQLFAWWGKEPSVELSVFEMDARPGDVGGSNASQLQVPATVRWESSSGVTVRGSLKVMARSWNTFRQGCWCGAGSQIGTSIRRIRRQSGGT